MPAPLIKICGISSVEALDAALVARADYCGLVFFPLSPRHVGMAEAARLAARSGGAIRRVGLFVDPGDALLADAVAAGRLDAIQLHGDETPERAAQIRDRFKLPVWKAIATASPADVARAGGYAESAELILFDAKTPKHAALPGGMGLRFDWSLLAGYRGATPWGLAGGLTPANVGEAIRQTRAPLVDTSSGVETAPGVKDIGLIRDFCRAVRAA